MKARMLLSPLQKIGSWKKMFLGGKKSLKKPAVELPHEIVELPQDIIESAILPRLPAKSLGRFMCVCKQWKSFISTHEFVRKNVQHLTNNQSLIHHKLLACNLFRLVGIDIEDLYNRSVPLFDAPRLNGAPQLSLIASLDGLVFVELPDTSESAFWNPLTGAYKKFKSNSPRFYTLVDAFYFDSSNKDYKVLQVTSYGSLNAYIYSQRLDSWKKIQWLENRQFNSNSYWSKPTFLGQRIYFMVRDCNNHVLIVFDVKSEKFREIQLPILNPSYAVAFESLVVLKGCIHFWVAYCTSNTLNKTSIMNCELWRMDGDGDGWTKLTTFSHTLDDAYNYKSLYPTRNGNWLGILKDNGVFYTIDMQDMARNFIIDYDKNWLYSTKQMLYIQTLVSPSA